MIRILNPEQLINLEQNYPTLDPRDIELDILCNSKLKNIKIPDCFIAPIFKEIYGVELDEVKFRDNNNLNWDYENIIFNYTIME